MRVRIDCEREERRIRTGWFALATIPAYCIGLTIHFSEEERPFSAVTLRPEHRLAG
jgi:hypothetical protein